jgi:hypothetical protein
MKRKSKILSASSGVAAEEQRQGLVCRGNGHVLGVDMLRGDAMCVHVGENEELCVRVVRSRKLRLSTLRDPPR